MANELSDCLQECEECLFREEAALTPSQDLPEKLVLAEIEGKNRAIHAYDAIAWKIRGGFLTLLFGGWSVLLTAVVRTEDRSAAADRPLAWGLAGWLPEQ